MNDFKFYVDADLIKSEKDGEEYQPWKVGGLASTNTRDAQGENLDYNGFELSDLKWINWDHGKSASDLIGQITSSKIKKGEGLYIDGELFQSKKQAQEAWAMMNDLKKSGSENRLSWSVQGKVLERDPANPKKVTKARLFQVALCPTPVNGDTWADVVSKGFTNSEDFSKAMDMEAVGDVTKESVEHNPKDLKNSSKNAEKVKEKYEEEEEEDDKKENKKRVLKKSEIYKEIFIKFTKNSAMADRVYNIMQKIDPMDITDETIEKALGILDLAKGENSKKTYKSEDEGEKENIKGKTDEGDEEEEEEVEKGKDKVKKSDPVAEEAVEKSENENDLVKSLTSHFDSKMSGLENLVKSQAAKFTALGQLYLSEKEENEELKKSIDTLSERLERVEETPIRKSVNTKKFTERFEKSENGEESNSGQSYDISKSQSKEALLNYLEVESGAANGTVTDHLLAKGMIELETVGTLTEPVLNRLFAKGISVHRS